MLSFKRKKSFGLKERLFYEFCLSVFMIMNSNQSETTLHANQCNFNIAFQDEKKKDLAWLPYVLDASGKLNQRAILENG